MLTQVTVTFTLEHLRPISEDEIAENMTALMEPEDSDNWFENCDQYAIYQPESLTVEVANATHQAN